MRKLFYPRLAAGNLKLNRRFYAPYLLTVMVCCSMFYNLNFVKFSQGLQRVGGVSTRYLLNVMLSLGIIVVGVFSFIFLLYSNSLLIKQRKRELGLYSVLGMQKRNIARVMLWESVCVNGLGSLLGLGIGILLSKLVLLILCAILRFDVPFGFEVSPAAILITTGMFLTISFMNLMLSLFRVSLLNPIDLLHGSSQGEKEPRTNWPLAALGVLSLGAGYVIAVRTVDPINAVTFFFEAVLLVILGTYCLFIAGSIALLRILKRKKDYYYKLRHFIAVSGMTYRMRRNGAGLASICILSTMVLVMISTTVCMNLGVEDLLNRRYPCDFQLVSDIYDENDLDALTPGQIEQRTFETLEAAGILVERREAYHYWVLSTLREGDSFQPCEDVIAVDQRSAYLTFLSLEELGLPVSLADGEALCIPLRGNGAKSITLGDMVFRCVDRSLNRDDLSAMFTRFTFFDELIVILPEAALERLMASDPLLGKYIHPMWRMGFDTPELTEKEKIALEDSLEQALFVVRELEDASAHGTLRVQVDCRARNSMDFYDLYGGLLFIGLFLGLLFLMATAMIIYYKQISEGYEDKKRYEIMQKVGMTRHEVRGTISSQILTVFFLPLAGAVIHLLFAFPMIRRMLLLFSLDNIGLFALCTLASVLVFAAVYSFIYWITARMYYHIVEG